MVCNHCVNHVRWVAYTVERMSMYDCKIKSVFTQLSPRCVLLFNTLPVKYKTWRSREPEKENSLRN